MISVSYRNNLDRVDPKIIDETTTTPRQFIESNGVTLGNYQLQVNGIPLTEEADWTFQRIMQEKGIDPDVTLRLAGIKPANGGQI